MQNLVAFSAKRDQIGLRIIAERAASSFVVNIEMLEATTELTPPTIARKDLFPQLCVGIRRQPDSSLL